jgi:nucleoid-associated protein YgaU
MDLPIPTNNPIHEANRQTIGDPNLIRPGQNLVIP